MPIDPVAGAGGTGGFAPGLPLPPGGGNGGGAGVSPDAGAGAAPDADASAGGTGALPFDAGASDGDAAALPGFDAAPAPPVCVAEPEVCDGLDNDCDGQADEGATCAAECAGFTLEDHGYMYCSIAVSRAEALGRCSLEGMRLVWIETREENDALVENIIGADVPAPEDNDELLTQIGASDAEDEGEWLWVGNDVSPDGPQFWQGGPADLDGVSVGGAFAPWSSTEPNDQDSEDCGILSVLGGTTRLPGEWDDRTCDGDSTLPFACETP
jgi:hypothetical protein